MINKNDYENVAFNQLEMLRNEINRTKMNRNLFNKIDNYYVLCIYEQQKIASNDHATKASTLTKNVITNSFVIWDHTYKESEQLFMNLRISSRNRVITEIAKNIVSFLLQQYEDQLNESLKRKSTHRNALQVEKYIHRMENMIKANTFLGEDTAWEEFCSWFQVYLTEWVLEELESLIGYDMMNQMSNEDLNEVFYQQMTKNLSSNDMFISKYTNIVNNYMTEWFHNIIESMKLAILTTEEIESMLQITTPKNHDTLPLSKSIALSLGVEQHLHVMNNAPYQYVREALYKNNFQHIENTPWPTTPLYKGNLEGIIQIRPFQPSEHSFATQLLIEKAQNQAQSLTDLDVDMFDALCSIFLSKARYTEDIIEIHFTDLLMIRGLKPKLGGEGRRGGYEQQQKDKVLQSLTKIQSLWLELNKATVYEKGKAVQTQLQGRTFLFVDHNRNEYDIAQLDKHKTFTFTVDKVFTKYLYGSGRQIALLPIQTLHYNPYSQKWEKRLARYFSWRWRTQARKGDFLQPNKIRTLLEAIGENVNERTPSRTRDRLEKALDQLLEDGVLSAWHYHKWDETIANNKGWVRLWLDSTILVEPPEIIKDQYRSIEKTKSPSHYSINFQDSAQHKAKGVTIGNQLRAIRKQFNLSLLQVSEELEISPSYISNIERGVKTPSVKIQNNISRWMQKFM
ncbi:helix-turn-helix domain-containing protein [Lysinibacillus sp. CD3-6]|uniref:helix-turn-helix domain-containing protein n=1 Tax=Lysinibacillus sp. CD3-6 TaxID=2892541 RepID=UPI00117334EA|nr:helix-turn-helix transcriptional regulator [Lysinibacillus sp. CD3-6]UED78147.1 helix-turn-helix domain-containing protein [Lysinibacillus sp. CD3-6]